MAADGGPEGDRSQAPVPAQGLRQDARTWTRSSRARAPGWRSRSWPSATGGWRTRSRSRRRGHGLQARGEGGRPRPGFYLFRGRGRDEVLPWDIVDNGVSKAYYLRELDKSRAEQLSPHCPEIQGCIRCGVCVETPNPVLRAPREVEGPRGAAALREDAAVEPRPPAQSRPGRPAIALREASAGRRRCRADPSRRNSTRPRRRRRRPVPRLFETLSRGPPAATSGVPCDGRRSDQTPRRSRRCGTHRDSATSQRTGPRPRHDAGIGAARHPAGRPGTSSRATATATGRLESQPTPS